MYLANQFNTCPWDTRNRRAPFRREAHGSRDGRRGEEEAVASTGLRLVSGAGRLALAPAGWLTSGRSPYPSPQSPQLLNEERSNNMLKPGTQYGLNMPMSVFHVSSRMRKTHHSPVQTAGGWGRGLVSLRATEPRFPLAPLPLSLGHGSALPMDWLPPSSSWPVPRGQLSAQDPQSLADVSALQLSRSQVSTLPLP